MIKEFFKTLSKVLPSDPQKVNKILVTTFLELNDLHPERSGLIRDLLIRSSNEDWKLYTQFKEYFLSYQTRFTFEDLIEVFELVVSPSDKKVNGAIYTPDNIKSYIINQVAHASTADLTKALVCDVSCGCGGFLYSYTQFLRKKYKLTYEFIYRNLIYGVDIAQYSIDRTAITLSLLAIGDGEDADFQFNLQVGDSLDFNWRTRFPQVGERNGFDLVIGNPPYVCAKNINDETRKLLEKWPVSASGNPDLYIPFFQIGLDALNENGILGYITVNSFTRSVNGRKLREYFHKESFSLSIVDFGGEQVFKGRTTYTCICIIGKQPRPYLTYCLRRSEELSMLADSDFVQIPYESLNDYQGWSLNSTSINTTLQKLRTSGIPLEKMADIRGGFATLKNSIFVFKPIDDNGTHFLLRTKSKEEYWIEKDICRNAVKANSLKSEKDFDKYLEKIIFPYKYQEQAGSLFPNSQSTNSRVVPLEEQELASLYPKAYNYLCAHRDALALRDKGGAGDYNAWYAFGRAQGLNVQGYKLLFPHISDRPYFVYTEDSKLLFYTGFSIVSWDSRRLRILQKVLTSPFFWFFVKHTNKPYSGEYFGLGKNFIKNFSIPTFTKQEENDLLACNDQNDINELLSRKYDVPVAVVTEQLPLATDATTILVSM